MEVGKHFSRKNILVLASGDKHKTAQHKYRNEVEIWAWTSSTQNPQSLLTVHSNQLALKTRNLSPGWGKSIYEQVPPGSPGMRAPHNLGHLSWNNTGVRTGDFSSSPFFCLLACFHSSLSFSAPFHPTPLSKTLCCVLTQGDQGLTHKNSHTIYSVQFTNETLQPFADPLTSAILFDPRFPSWVVTSLWGLDATEPPKNQSWLPPQAKLHGSSLQRSPPPAVWNLERHLMN